MTSTNNTATRYNTKRCKHCNTVTSVLIVEITREAMKHPVQGAGSVAITDKGTRVWLSNQEAIVTCRGCGAECWAKPVLGRYVADKKCDGRCESATGHQCECQCGGKNHGRAHG